MSRSFKNRWLVFILFLAIASCSPLVRSEQPERSAFISLQEGKTLGQTFTARMDGLQAVSLYLKPGQAGDGLLRLHLRLSPQDTQDLATAGLPLSRVSSPGYYNFAFPLLENSNRQDYSLSLEMQGTGQVQVGVSSGESYPDGALYLDGQPQDEQLTFRLSYYRAQALAGLASEGIYWLGLLAASLFLFTLPGWALFSLAWSGWEGLSWGEKLGASAGLSLALYPLLFLWADLAGLHPGPLFAWLPPLAGLLAILWLRRGGSFKPDKVMSHLEGIVWKGADSGRETRHYRPSPNFWPDLALLAVLGLVFFTRFWAIRGLDVPMWGDSYQHTLMAQLFVDHGGLFQSWAPYTPYRSLTVHYGFSSLAALFTWLAGLPSTTATLVAGQVVNGLAVLSLYPLTMRISPSNRWVGVGAVLAAGLLSPMPAFYVNWGRYAQLAGQAILPVALWALWASLDPGPGEDRNQDGVPSRASLPWRKLLLAGALLAGMLLTYYRMPFYYAAFVFVWLLGWVLPRRRSDLRRWGMAALGLAFTAVVGFLLFLPWGLRLRGGKLSGAVEAGLSTASPLQSVLGDYRSWLELDFFLPRLLLALALVALAWSLARKKWIIPALVLWVLLLAGYVSGQLISLPGANMMQNFAVLIAIYIPAGLVVGWLVGEAAESLYRRAGSIGAVAMTLVLIALAGWGAWKLKGVAQPDTYNMVTRPDLRAMQWIRLNTPAEANFLVEGFPSAGVRSVVGSDAGWWIPLLAGRRNSMPPQYALLNEVPDPPGYTQAVVELVAGLQAAPVSSRRGIQMLCSQGITHLYIGQRQGQVGYTAAPLFQAGELVASPTYDLVYHQDRVYIFALKPGSCGAAQ